MEWDLIHSFSIGELYLITGTYSILLVNWYNWYQWNNIIPFIFHWWNTSHYWDLGIYLLASGWVGGVFYLSIGRIGTSGITFIPLVFHSEMHLIMGRYRILTVLADLICNFTNVVKLHCITDTYIKTNFVFMNVIYNYNIWWRSVFNIKWNKSA